MRTIDAINALCYAPVVPSAELGVRVPLTLHAVWVVLLALFVVPPAVVADVTSFLEPGPQQ